MSSVEVLGSLDGYPPLLTIEEAAEVMRIGRSLAYAMAHHYESSDGRDGDQVSAMRSSWGRPDVLQAICDLQRPVASMSGHRWADALEGAAAHVIARLLDLDPVGDTSRRGSDGRSVWVEPTAPRGGPGPGGGDHHVRDGRPGRPTFTVEHRRPHRA